MPGGRPPKPTAQKKLEGNPGKRALNEDEPEPSSEMPGCPGWLNKEGKSEWRRVALELNKIGVLTSVDRAALAAYCQWWARWVEAEKVIEEKGATFEDIRIIDTAVGEQPIVVGVKTRPEVRIAKDASAMMKSYAVELGLTPAARTRVKADKPDPAKAKILQFMKGGPSA